MGAPDNQRPSILSCQNNPRQSTIMSSNPDHVKADGTPDMRYKENQSGEAQAAKSEGGQKGGSASGGSSSSGSSDAAGNANDSTGTYRPSEHDGLKKDGTVDKRTQSDHGFGGNDGPDPHVEGQKGGKTS